MPSDLSRHVSARTETATRVDSIQANTDKASTGANVTQTRCDDGAGDLCIFEALWLRGNSDENMRCAKSNRRVDVPVQEYLPAVIVLSHFTHMYYCQNVSS